MAKKPPIKKPPIKKTVKKATIPQEILTKLKRVKSKFFKDETLKEVKETYLEIYIDDKKEHKNKGWRNEIFHKRALTKLKNKKKAERLGGAIDKYYGIIFGASNVIDLSQNRRTEIIEIYEEDPEKATNEGLIMVRKATNPVTGEVESVPILDETGGIIPRDNIEYGTNKNGKKFKNPGYTHAIAPAYRRNITGVSINTQGVKGVFIHELRSKSVNLDIPLNVVVKFSGKTIGTELITLSENKYIDRELLEEMITILDDDIEQEKISEEYAKNMKEHYTKLLSITKKKKKKKEEEKPEEKPEEIEITLFKLRSTKGTAFIKVENEKEYESIDFPMKDYMQPDINLLYKKYFYPFTSDCSNLLKYHEDHRFIDNDPKKINWNEIVCLQDVNLIQINMEASMAGNYTLFIEDESLFNKDVSHLDIDIDAIKILVPGHIKLNFAQDSKLNVVGSPVQFQAQDDEREELWETEIDEDGNEIKVPVMAYPLIMVQGIYPIPEYMIPVDTVDLTFEDEIDVNEIFEDSKKKPKEQPKKDLEIEEDDIEEDDKVGAEDIPDAIKDVIELEEDIKSKIPKKKTAKTPEEPDDTINDEDEKEDSDLW